MTASSQYETVVLEWQTPEIAWITLDRPDAGNSLSTALVRDLIAAVDEVRFAPEAKVLVITGGGRFFCAGADLKERDKPASWIWDVRRAFDLIADLPVPVIAAINGACMGGGTELALACDFRIAAESVQIGLPEIKFGALPAAGGPQRLLRVVGPTQAKLLIMTGEPVAAQQALDIGLVIEVTEDGSLRGRAENLAAQLAERAGYALRTTKFVINRGENVPLSDGLLIDYESMERMATSAERAAEVRKARERSATYASIFSGD